MVVWMAEQPLQPGRRYAIKLASTTVDGTVRDIEHRVDVNTLEKGRADQLGLNEIGLCHLVLEKTVAFDRYRDNRTMGAFIIIDRMTHVTVGAGMIRGKTEVGEDSLRPVSAHDRQVRLGHKPAWVVLPEGLDPKRLERNFFDRGYLPVIVNYGLEGDWRAKAEALCHAGLIVLVAGMPVDCTQDDYPENAIFMGNDISAIDNVLSNI
ncbi:sulfate adenylyltransferase subunit 1 [Elysia marginata]|uniref:Sulfate adenylyltransferase subunit 1 n=1 Tax=Elysia marginata TaxID=1093978 RepID=A0AAV4GPX7_9GAST|nr:sulfate adenylyltransferase subunit 1 [Elysia marginata]